MATAYRGELSKKLAPKQEAKKMAALLRDDEQALRALIKEEHDQQMAKLPALLQHFGIDEEDDFSQACFELMMCLAEAHVPGFQFQKARGAPKKWSYDMRIKAAIALGKLAAEHPTKSENNLAIILHSKEPWSSLSKTPGALLKQIRLFNREAAIAQEVWAEVRPLNKLADLLVRGS